MRRLIDLQLELLRISITGLKYFLWEVLVVLIQHPTKLLKMFCANSAIDCKNGIIFLYCPAIFNGTSFLSLSKVLDPEKQADLLDSLRICLLQFSTLLVEHAPHHIHDNNKSRNSKLRRLMTFAWPCLLPKACVDPACKYSGHLLLAHIIAKFAIHKKIVLQVRANKCFNAEKGHNRKMTKDGFENGT